ncbi:RNA polymerase, Rpb8 like protein [Aduncisulcus paluster]|uniref:DNA-directed RNA polymerases I, II, and III subunit RPABC3 n=1 Tax=Aduncisulcus paluster TaxID=2918883 RepID=A0ABQ5KJ27_9EUKA|nr:RNA polymerase, Rpb8 like protein [Aduncisulcus paluster]
MSTLHPLYAGGFLVKSVDKEGKVFDTISRMDCENDEGVTLVLDVHSGLFTVKERDNIEVTIYTAQSSGKEKFVYDPAKLDFIRGSACDYVMCGRVFKFEPSKDESVLKVFISFGGLMCQFEGPVEKFTEFKLDDVVYIMLASRT